MMKNNTIKVNTRVNHKAFGDGTIIETNNRYTMVLFDEGETKRFLNNAFLSMDFFVTKDSNCDNTRISRIIVSKLFDRLDYDINIALNNNVSILSAPNGCGKTTIFKFLDFIFNPGTKSFSQIKAIPFERFSCLLDNGYKLELTREPLEAQQKESRKMHDPSNYNVAVSLLGSEYDFVFYIMDDTTNPHRISFTQTVIDDRRSGVSHSYYEDDDDYEEIQYVTGMGMARYGRFFALIDAAVRKYGCKINLDFIVANRLQKIYVTQGSRNSSVHSNREPEKVDYLKLARDEMVTNITNWRNEYAALSEIAKSKLPSMYIASTDPTDVSFQDFEIRWNKYHQELQKFYELGILEEREAIIDSNQLKNAFTQKRAFLVTYLDAFEGTLAPLQDNYGKLKLFADIFHKRNEITQKRIKFTPNGIEIYTGEKRIDIDCLSSGEKNDFVMFYRLIFNTEKHGVVLIDEPEISLHIEWQEEYLDRLIEICKMNSLQAIVATHSPNIVNGHFDLFVDKR